MTEALTSTRRQAFPGISSRAFEHPADRAALTALRKVPGFDIVVRRFVSLMRERSLRYLFLASAVRVGPRQFSRLDAIYGDCLRVLDVPERPELFVAQTPFVNAGAIGAHKPFIVLNSGTLELLDDDEIRHVLGHELAHILSGHVLFKTMLALLLRFSTERLGIPLVGLARSAIVAALTEWDRKSELSSDRAGLLCVQDPVACSRVFMKLAGGRDTRQMDVGAFVEQAEEYEAGGDRLDSIFKIFNLMGTRHPFWVLRLAELRKWVEQGGYQDILDGKYPKRDSDPGAKVLDELSESAKAYKASATDTKDPLIQTLRDIGSQIVEGGGSLWSSLKSRFAAKPAEGQPEAPGEASDAAGGDSDSDRPKSESSN